MEQAGTFDFNNLLKLIFEPELDESGVWKIDAVEALVVFARDYAVRIGEDPDVVIFNELGLLEMVDRFGRDAWGTKRFHNQIARLFEELEIDASNIERVVENLGGVGVRINTDAPRKTRVVAVMSLWMSTFRPIFVDGALSAIQIMDNMPNSNLLIFLFTTYDYSSKP